jgi:hypothetical protein
MIGKDMEGSGRSFCKVLFRYLPGGINNTEILKKPNMDICDDREKVSGKLTVETDSIKNAKMGQTLITKPRGCKAAVAQAV